ncbi:redoxin domain-containing protein [Pseudomonas fragi]|uniref:Redoxin domain-containing protein n=1 Tax=Pseudomonas fragi TaxID=296 RepID=A0ABT4WW12_PSEFR|nr:redoxin domain-containing protein [Pseudomonas fragi]MDA7024100.1 redoxin domain-containing protein [Pseudomonas fragi]
MSAYQQMVSDLTAAGATLVAVSAQTPQFTGKTREALGITYLLLSDTDNHLARQYGIVFELEDELDQIYRSLGADLKSVNGSDSLTLPLASAFVIDQDAVIREAFFNLDYAQRVEPEELIAAVGRV